MTSAVNTEDLDRTLRFFKSEFKGTELELRYLLVNIIGAVMFSPESEKKTKAMEEMGKMWPMTMLGIYTDILKTAEKQKDEGGGAEGVSWV